jgi:hypothetical protein
MFTKIKKIWENNGFEILIALCLAFLIIYGVYRIFTNKKGSWSKTYTTYSVKDINNLKVNSNNKKKPPKESKGELECKRVLEKIFNKPFNKHRPNFLNNPVTGGEFNLELDCYNDEIGLAVEYSGKQHYEYIPFFHKNKEAFYNQKYRDELKRRMCKDNNIILIEVPYTVKIEDIENFILKRLKNINF